MSKAHHLDTVAAKFRSGFSIVSALNQKSPKGESAGYLTAMIYLAPATLAGGKTVCPHSTEACRTGCLFTAGRGKTPRVVNARIRRTRMYLNDRDRFFDELIGELVQMQDAADEHGMTLAIRLNGLSDIQWERETFEDGQTLFTMFSRAIFYDYTRFPPQHRKVPANWSLTYSLADSPLSYAIDHLRAGRNVAAIVPEHKKARAPEWFGLGDLTVQVVDGERDDARFLDPSPALVLLRPKGRLLSGNNPMVRSNLISDLVRLGRSVA